MKRRLSSGVQSGRVSGLDSSKRGDGGGGVKMAKVPELTLGADELQLTELLRDACASWRDTQPITVRYAGGWVRDKLLDRPSHDVDVAVSSLSGHEFAVRFAAYVDGRGLRLGKIGKILANPEKSKHLDTATAKFGAIECDFVQLRTESYAASGDTRTPSHTAVGTLQEDAQRRDCTMNALYYNVHTMKVEDPTGRGIDDLRAGLIRTPLEPRQTFLDDPLRVLRCIRFASQFAFEIDGPTFETMASAEVVEALGRKVVRERIGIELQKAMVGADPARAIRALHSRGLYEVVFGAPIDDFGVVTQAIDALEVDRFASLPQDGRLWLASALLPYAHMAVDDRRGLPEPQACVVVRDALKLPSSMDAAMRAIFPPRKTMAQGGVLPDITVIDGQLAIVVDEPQLEARDHQIRMCLARTVRMLGQNWPLSLFVACQLGSYEVEGAFPYLYGLLTQTYPDLALAHTAKPALGGKVLRQEVFDAVGCKKEDVKLMGPLVERCVLLRCADPDMPDDKLIALLKRYMLDDLMKTTTTA